MSSPEQSLQQAYDDADNRYVLTLACHRLRDDWHMSLRDIGIALGISHEHVRKLLSTVVDR